MLWSFQAHDFFRPADCYYSRQGFFLFSDNHLCKSRGNAKGKLIEK